MLLLLILLRQTGALEMCSLGHWWCQSSNQTGECISVYQRCRGQCVSSAEAGFRAGYSWCPESQQCIPPGVKCAVMWGVGCGKSSFFCWRGNVCLPKSLPCNGFCTQYYRLTVSSSCQFDPELVIPQPRTEVRRSSGTLAPVTTISLLLLGTAVGLVIRKYRAVIIKNLCKLNTGPDPGRGQPPTVSDLEMIEARDPFMIKCDNVKTFSVAERDHFINK